MSKPARRVLGMTFDGKPIFEPITSAYCRIALNSNSQMASRDQLIQAGMLDENA